MLPTKPQSILDILLNSIKTYKKNFILILPISVVLVASNMAFILVTTKVFSNLGILNRLFKDLLSFFGFFVFCWGICFVYNVIIEQGTNYITSLRTISKKVIQIVLLSIVWDIFTSIFMLFLGIASNLFLTKPLIWAIAFTIAVTILFLPIMCFTFIFTLDSLVNDIKILSMLKSIKKAARLSFRVESMWRILCFAMVMILCFPINLVLSLVIVKLWALFYLKSFIIKMVILMVFNFLILTLFWIPLKLTIFIYIYNDLVLRFEKLL